MHRLRTEVVGVALVIGAVMAGCMAQTLIRVPPPAFDKAFDSALATGIQLEYTPKYKDKDNRTIQFEKMSGHSRWTINVLFSPDASGDLIAKVTGRIAEEQGSGDAGKLAGAIMTSSYMSSDVEKIEAAIVAAGGRKAE